MASCSASSLQGEPDLPSSASDVTMRELADLYNDSRSEVSDDVDDADGKFGATMKQLVQQMLNGIPGAWARTAISQLMNKIQSSTLTFGTACSGTDLAWVMLNTIMDSTPFKEAGLRIQHVFS